MDGNGISSVLVVFYLGRHFRKCMRCVLVFGRTGYHGWQRYLVGSGRILPW
jgi:hypothetical protein